MINCWLVVQYPSWKMMEFVNGKDDIPYISPDTCSSANIFQASHSHMEPAMEIGRRSCGGMIFACPKHGGWPPKTKILLGGSSHLVNGL